MTQQTMIGALPGLQPSRDLLKMYWNAARAYKLAALEMVTVKVIDGN